MRLQRDIAYNKALVKLKENVINMIFEFNYEFLSKIGVKNRNKINNISEYINSDIQPIFKNTYQEKIVISNHKTKELKIFIALNKSEFEKEFKRIALKNYKQDIEIWSLFIEQNSQNIYNNLLSMIDG